MEHRERAPTQLQSIHPKEWLAYAGCGGCCGLSKWSLLITYYGPSRVPRLDGWAGLGKAFFARVRRAEHCREPALRKSRGIFVSSPDVNGGRRTQDEMENGVNLQGPGAAEQAAG